MAQPVGIPGVTINNAINGLTAPAQPLQQQPAVANDVPPQPRVAFGEGLGLGMGLNATLSAQTGIRSASMSPQAADTSSAVSGTGASGGLNNVTHVNGQEVTFARAEMVPKPHDVVQPFFLPGQANVDNKDGDDLPTHRRLLAHGREVSEMEINLDEFMEAAGILTFSTYTISKADAKKELAQQLEGIAREQYTTVELLKRHNGIKNNPKAFEEGAKLKIPYVEQPKEIQKGRASEDAIKEIRDMCRTLLGQAYMKFLHSGPDSLPFSRETCTELANLNDELEAQQKIITNPSGAGSAQGAVRVDIRALRIAQDQTCCGVQQPACCTRTCKDRFMYVMVAVAVIGVIFLVFVSPSDVTSSPVGQLVVSYGTKASTGVSIATGGYGLYAKRKKEKLEERIRKEEQEQARSDKEAAEKRLAKAVAEKDRIHAQIASCLQRDRDERVSYMCRSLIADFTDATPFDLDIDVDGARKAVYRKPVQRHLLRMKEKAITYSLTRLPECEKNVVTSMQKFIKITNPDLQGKTLFNLFKQAVHLYYVPPGVAPSLVVNNTWYATHVAIVRDRDRMVTEARARLAKREALGDVEFPDTQSVNDTLDLFPLSLATLVPGRRKAEHKNVPPTPKVSPPESPAAVNGASHTRRASTQQPAAANANGAVADALKEPLDDLKHTPPVGPKAPEGVIANGTATRTQTLQPLSPTGEAPGKKTPKSPRHGGLGQNGAGAKSPRPGPGRGTAAHR